MPTSTLLTYICDDHADPEISIYRGEAEDGDRYVTLSILRDLELRGKDSLRVLMSEPIFQEILSKGEEALRVDHPGCSACTHLYRKHFQTFDNTKVGCTGGSSLGDCNCTGYYQQREE